MRPGITFTLPLCIWTLNAFFRDLPRELEESTLVDGCTRMQALIKIVAPLAASGVFTAAVAITQFEGSDITIAPPSGQISATSVISTLPLIVLVLLFQRRIISGLTSGAVKG